MMENKIKKAMLLMFCLVLASCNNSNNDADVTVTSGSGDDSSGSDVPPPTGPSNPEVPSCEAQNGEECSLEEDCFDGDWLTEAVLRNGQDIEEVTIERLADNTIRVFYDEIVNPQIGRPYSIDAKISDSTYIVEINNVSYEFTTSDTDGCNLQIDELDITIDETEEEDDPTSMCVPEAETCDGIDNDCDRAIDNDLGATTCGVGACENTVNNCVDGIVQRCNPFEGVSIEIFDGVDNDCDGIVDEYVEDPFVIHPYLFILTKNSIKFVGDDCPLEDDSCCKIEGNGETVYFIDNENYRIALPDYVVQADEKSFDLDFELPNEDILFIEDKFAEFNDWVGDMSEGRIQSEPMIFRKEINITFSKYGCDFVLLPIDTDMAGITDDYKDTIDTAIIISATKSNDGYFLPIFQCGSTINSDDESPYLSFPHSYIPYSFDYFEDMNCFSTNTLFHEWAHGLHYGYSFISEIDVIKQPEEIIQNLSDLAGGKENICSLSDNDLRYSYTTWHFGDCSQFWDPFQPTCNMNYYSMPECCDGATEECKVYPIPEKFREYNIAWLSHFNFSKEIYFNKLKK